MGKYAKNYLPIMFNIYTTDESSLKSNESSIRQAIFDSIKCYLKIAEATLVNQYLLQAVRNYENYSKISQAKQKELTETAVAVRNKEEKETTSKTTTTANKPGKVMFDFSSTSNSKSVTLGAEKTEKTIDAYKSAEYSFLDLISLLVRYSNEANIKLVYELATDGIQVNEKQKKFLLILNSIEICCFYF
jgi:hypothetical protein